MVILYVSLVVLGCVRHSFYPALDLLGLCVCTTEKIFSVHKHTSFYRPNQEECVCAFACVCLRMRVCVSCVHLYLPACKSGSRSIHSELNLTSRLLIMKFLTEKMGFSEWIAMYSTWLICTFCWLLSKWIHPSPGVSSYHSPPVYPVSRDVSLLHWILLYTLQIIRHITSSLSHTSPQCLSAHCLPFVCVRVCARVCMGACTRMLACAQACAIEECSVFPMSGVIFRIYLHTLLVHNWHPSLSCLMRYHYINLLTK